MVTFISSRPRIISAFVEIISGQPLRLPFLRPRHLPTFRPLPAKMALACIDGGVWANCPATVGIIEAIAVLGQRLEDIEVLSIGTTDEPYDVSEVRRKKGGLIRWGHFGNDLVGLMMQAQMKASIAQANVLLHGRFLRIDERTRPSRFQMDDASQIADLRGLGTTKARHDANRIEKEFLNQPAELFVPVHASPS